MTPFLALEDCGLCSRLPLLYNLIGMLLPLTGKQWFYFCSIALLLQGVATAFQLSVPLLVGFAHLVPGLLSGCLLRWLHKIQLAPNSVLQHKHAVMWFSGELLCLVLAFPYIDSIVPETGFNYGIWLSLLLLLIWWGAVFFVNHNRLLNSDAGEVYETRLYERSWLLLLGNQLCFVGAYLFHFWPHCAVATFGLLAAGLFTVATSKISL